FIFFLFFFSSRRRHTRSKRDWSSDVCSSDLTSWSFVCESAGLRHEETAGWCQSHRRPYLFRLLRKSAGRASSPGADCFRRTYERSEERRVGKECRSRWSREH